MARMVRWMVAAGFVVAWSSGFVGATLADRAAPPLTLLAWRYLVTAAVVGLFCLALPAGRRALGALTAAEVARQAVLGVLAHVVFLGGVFLAAGEGLDAGISAVVCALQPMVVAAAGRLLFADRLGPREYGGLILGIGGVTLSVGGVDTAAMAGVWLVVASLLGLSCAALLERLWAPRATLLVSLALQVAVAAAIFTVAALATTGLRVEPTPTLTAALVWLVLLSGLGGYATFIWCLRELGPTRTSTLLYLTPPVTTLWAWAMFGQRPGLLQWAGLAVVLAAVLLALPKVAWRRSPRPALSASP